jgi:arylsulfatase A-like enzyme
VRRRAALLCGAWLAVCAGVGFAASARPDAETATAASLERPNVVVIETDDQTLESMKVMDAVRRRIADRGVSFQNSFVNFSLCCPSRATFLTGQYAHNHRVLGNSAPRGGASKFDRLHADDNLAVWLSRAGYRTALIGKYLNGYFANPVEPPGWTEWNAAVGAAVYDYALNQNGQIVHYGAKASDFKQDVFTERALAFIRSSAAQPEPFFLWLTYSSPHTNPPDPNPRPPHYCEGAAKPAPPDAGALASERLPMPPGFNELDTSDKPQAIRRLPRLRPPEIADMRRRYVCALESLLSVDRGVDRVLTELGSSGELADTYVIYTSDNGFLNGAHRIARGKIWPYEESIRVPLLIRGPGIPAGRTAHDLAINADLAPTIVEATGAEAGLSVDGRSLLPAARDPRLERGRELQIESTSFTAIRTRRYLYVEHESGERELYDLNRDPHELENAIDLSAYREVASALAARLGGLGECVGEACRRSPRVGLRLDYAIGHHQERVCALNPIRARLVGAEAAGVVEAEFGIGALPYVADDRPPFERTLPAVHGPATVRLRATMLDGRRATIARALRVCR